MVPHRRYARALARVCRRERRVVIGRDISLVVRFQRHCHGQCRTRPGRLAEHCDLGGVNTVSFGVGAHIAASCRARPGRQKVGSRSCCRGLCWATRPERCPDRPSACTTVVDREDGEALGCKALAAVRKHRSSGLSSTRRRARRAEPRAPRRNASRRP